MTAPPVSNTVVMAVNRWWWPATGAVVVAAWVGVAMAHTTRVPPLAAAAAAGTAALAAGPPLSVAGVPGLAGVVALLVLPAAVAEAARDGNAALLGVVLGGLAIATVVSRVRDAALPAASAAVALGVAGVVTAMASGSLEATRVHFVVADRPAAAVMLAGAALVLTGVDHRLKAERALLAPVLLAALLATPALPALAVILGWGALAVGAALVDRPAVALGGAAVVAAAAGVAPAGLLLAAAAVLVTALDSGAAVLCALPGAVVLADALAARPTTAVGIAGGLALGATALALALRLRPGVRVDGGRPVALALAAWLLIAPGTWGFTGADTLRAYDVGASRALATGALVGLALLFRRGGEFAWAPPPADDPSEPADLLARPAAAGVVAGMATVASVGWLVVSVVRLH